MAVKECMFAAISLLIVPEASKLVTAELRVANSVLDVLVSEVLLNRAGITSLGAASW